MILLATTSVQLLSPGADDTEGEDWGGAPSVETGYSPVGSPVRAHLSAPSGVASASMMGGDTSSVFYRLLCDPCDLKPNMRVQDMNSGITYDVQWALERPEPLSCVVAGVTYVTDSA